MDGHFTMDERRWREKVRRFEFEAKDLRTERDKLREELNIFLGKPSVDEAVTQINHLTEQVKLLTAERDDLVTKLDAADAEVKALNHKVGGLKMTLGRYTKKDKN
jgi:chromosome segregation ATPase